MNKKERWVTINGHHVLIGSDGTPVNEDDKERFGKKRSIHDLVDKDYNKLNEDERTAQKQVSENYKLKEQYTKEWLEGKKELKKHWVADEDVDAELAELFGSVGLGGHYDEEGKMIKAKTDIAYEKMKHHEELYNNATEYIERKHKEHAKEEKLAWKDPKDVPATQKSYEGWDTDNRTTIPYYEELIKSGKAKLVEMSPKEYMQRIAYDIFGSTMDRTTLGVDSKNIEKYAKMMQEGTKFHVGFIDYRRKEQEGRHRALAAYLNGYEKIPVWVIR